MSAGDVLKTDEAKPADADEIDRQSETDASAAKHAVKADDSHESAEDDAWLDACREETAEAEDGDPPNAPQDAEDDKAFEDNVAALSADLNRLRRRNTDAEIEAALADLEQRIAAMEKTGNEAMSTLGQAMSAIADRIDDLEDKRERDAFEAAAEQASPSSRRAAVAPYIENAEREIEAAKGSAAIDIFDRIAQAAESQFDESRGSTAKRVSQLVDDRRVGTKRWTPSKTVKARMEKLEAARRAAEEAAAPEPQETPEPQDEPEAVVAQEAVETAQLAEEERVVISRRQKQHSEDAVAEAAEHDQPETDEPMDDFDAEDDDDAALRIIPGARGRRRDRARKSRLDEDFEKIFEDDGKPSIGSLRRKLRGAATADAAEEGADETPPTEAAAVTEETYGTVEKEPAAKTGLFSKLFKSRSKKAAADTEIGEAAEDTVDAFTPDEALLTDTADFEAAAEGVAEGATEAVAKAQLSDNERRQRQIVVPIIVTAIAIAAGGAGFFLYITLFGG